ncbi:hypothetical protein ACIO3R_00990 [Streptomyces sp. NPDC087428]|uniref:hypothetical protein n=1 Tax=Streptomyces sp. NPDC087428 TaxID=3365788 RepID=UPI003828E5F2
MDNAKHHAPARYESGDGCLTTLVRIPVRIVVLVLVLPVRMVWDALVACARAADRTVLRPLGRALSWLFQILVVAPARLLWERVLTPVGHALRWVYLTLLAPAGRGIRTGTGWLLKAVLVLPVVGVWRYVLVPLGPVAARLARHLVVRPARWTYRELLTPLGHGIAAGLRGLRAGLDLLVPVLLVTPLAWAYRWVLTPVGREIAAAIGVAWRIAGFVSRAVGRVLARLAWYLVGAPLSWAHRTVFTPMGHFVRDAVWAPVRRAAVAAGLTALDAVRTARETVRQARRDAWRALVGGPPVTEPREPGSPLARTLGTVHHATTVPSAAPEPEISLPGEHSVRRG